MAKTKGKNLVGCVPSVGHVRQQEVSACVACGDAFGTLGWHVVGLIVVIPPALGRSVNNLSYYVVDEVIGGSKMSLSKLGNIGSA